MRPRWQNWESPGSNVTPQFLRDLNSFSSLGLALRPHVFSRSLFHLPVPGETTCKRLELSDEHDVDGDSSSDRKYKLRSRPE